MRILLALLLVLPCASPGVASIVTLYGARGSFGTLRGTLPSGGSVARRRVRGWQLDPGQAAFFPAVAADGTVFVANLPQTFNQFLLTACDMVVTCFHPRRRTCRDADAAGTRAFANLRIPTATGSRFVPPGDCAAVSAFEALGADVADIAVVPDPTAGERVVFASTWGSLASTDPDAFPAFGAITKTGGAWTPDAAASRGPVALGASNPPVSVAACPSAPKRCCADADCGPGGTCTDAMCGVAALGTCVVACAAPSDCGAGQTCVAGRCESVGCGALNEMARLPRSGRLVVSEYAGSRLAVVDTDGTILAAYAFPTVPAPCGGGPVSVLPREVDADPTSPLGDERFAIVFDTSDPRGQPLQEFRYDDRTRALAPVSAPVFTATAANPAPACGETKQGQGAQYDHRGNLWVARSRGVGGGPLGVYLRDATTGVRRLDGPCSAIDPATGLPRPWGSPCTADVDVGAIPWAIHVLEDATSGAMLVVGYGGEVVAITPGPNADGTPFAVRPTIDLGLARLRAPEPGATLTASKAAIDGTRRALWVPVTTREPVVENVPGCSCFFCGCAFAVGRSRDTWLYRVDLGRALGSGPAAAGRRGTRSRS